MQMSSLALLALSCAPLLAASFQSSFLPPANLAPSSLPTSSSSSTAETTTLETHPFFPNVINPRYYPDLHRIAHSTLPPLLPEKPVLFDYYCPSLMSFNVNSPVSNGTLSITSTCFSLQALKAMKYQDKVSELFLGDFLLFPLFSGENSGVLDVHQCDIVSIGVIYCLLMDGQSSPRLCLLLSFPS